MYSWIGTLASFAAEATNDPLSPGAFAQYGTLGGITAGLVIFARGSYKRETDRSDRLEAEVLRLNNLIIERVFPALSSAAQAAEEATQLLRDMQRTQEMNLLRGAPPQARRARPGGEDRQ